MNACKAIVEWGIPYLDEVGNPELEPPLSAQRYLFDNASQLAATFNEKYEVGGSNEEYVKKIREKLLERKLLCY